jgi:hypothetical protein
VTTSPAPVRARSNAQSTQLAATAAIAAPSAVGLRIFPAPAASSVATISGTATASGASAMPRAPR